MPYLTTAKPFSIRGVLVDPPVVLAPMADVTNGAFRRLCKRIAGPGLVCTEQISTQALHYKSERTLKMIDWTDEERPLSVQLFGADPVIMAEAARILAGAGADVIDINMGCWVPKVCKQGAGAALLRDEPTAIRVVAAVINAVSIPVTVKMRAGWEGNTLTSASLAREFEQLGAQAFTLHARMARQGFEGTADWRWIREIKEAVSVPVIGNGDIRTPQDAEAMMRDTGCDGVMIGRAAIGDPWALRDIVSYLQTRVIPPPPTLEERRDGALEHVRDLAAAMGEDRAVRHLRGQLTHYARGFVGATRARERIVSANTIAEIEAVFGELAVATR